MNFDLIVIFGMLAAVIGAVGSAFWLGGQFKQRQFLAKGHEEVNKHIAKQSEQLRKVSNKYEKLKKRLADGGVPFGDITDGKLHHVSREDAEVSEAPKT